MPATSVNINSNKVLLTLSSSDYSFVKSQISENSNYFYTASNFRIKNLITEISLYSQNSYNKFGFLIKFDKIINFSENIEITLKGFSNTSYNTIYKVVKVIDQFNAVLAPINNLPIALPTGTLGFYSVIYSNGLNGLKIIQDEGFNVVSFLMEQNEISSVDNVGKLDLETMPNLWFYQKNILQLNFQTFLKNLTERNNDEYLIIDTTSLVGSPLRNNNNNSDAPYSSFGNNAYFYRNYTINIIYLLQRSIDDEKNLTNTGADIATKQVLMHDALTSILRRPIPSTTKKIASSITITEDAVDNSIIEGSVIINYQCQFSVQFLPDALLDIQESGIYDINQINYNSDKISV